MKTRFAPWHWPGRLAALASGLVLWTAYPPVEQPAYAWIALAPLLLAVRKASSRREAFRLGYLSGLVFWLLNLYWMWRLLANNGPFPLVAAGHIGLAMYCALYTGLFALAVQVLWSRPSLPGHAGRLARVVVGEPLLWIGSEYLRAILFSGFAWNFLGVSQYRSTALIQVAGWGGVYAVSGLLLMTNGAVAGLLERIWRQLRHRKAGYNFDLTVVIAIVFIAWFLGLRDMRNCRLTMEPGNRVTLAAIQPNAPSVFESGGTSISDIRYELVRLSEIAAMSSPDLIVWPETALPGTLPLDWQSAKMTSDLAFELQTPILAGALEFAADCRRGDGKTYNSSFLFTADGTIADLYRKQHLVPFGEFVPLASVFPRLNVLSPIGYSCSPGKEAVVMRLPAGRAGEREFTFSPLICFESTVARLSRKAVGNGARLLVNQTNDAWFDGSSEPRQHLAQAVFRSVETRTPMLRSANNGVSALIDARGRLDELRQNGQRDGFAGIMVRSVNLPEKPSVTPYLRFGDWLLAIPSFLWLVAILLYDARLRWSVMRDQK